MKVCIVTTQFPRWIGDHRAPFVYEAARALQARGLAVRVVAMHRPGVKVKENWHGIEIIRPRYLPEKWEVLQTESGGLPDVWRRRPMARLAFLPFILVHTLGTARFARDCDIVHANWTLSGAAAWASSVWHRKPFVVTVQGSDIFQATRLPLVSLITRMVLTRAARVLALSHALADATISLGVPAGQVEVVPNGVDTDRFRPTAKEREAIILFVGALIERKGARYLIEAFPMVGRELPRARLVIVGEGSQREELMELSRHMGVAERVIFAGGQTQEQVRHWMQHARVFVLPSLEEGLGVVLLEALACGTPCVATRVGGIPDVVTPEVGLVVPPGDVHALATAIREVLEDRVRWNVLSQQARTRAVEQYSWKIIATRILQIYQSQLNLGR